MISKDKLKAAQLEVVTTGARLALTRLLRSAIRITDSGDSHEINELELIRKNSVVNLANTVAGRPIFGLQLDLDESGYHPSVYAWHYGEFELIMRRPDTPELVEVIADLIDEKYLSAGAVNDILKADGCGLQFTSDKTGADIDLVDLDQLDADPVDPDEHPNVRKLIERMDRAMQNGDWPLVLHSGASIFETMAKQIVTDPQVQNRSLGGWIGLYRNKSSLSAPLLDVIEEIFSRRNTDPLAGHGSDFSTKTTEEEALQIRELSIVFVKMERALSAARLRKVGA